MTAQHTPGPWVWEGDYTLRPAKPDPDASSVHTILDCESIGYGFIESDPAATTSELAADRRLIASAPDLLQALELIRSSCWPGRVLMADTVARICDEAISKATAS